MSPPKKCRDWMSQITGYLAFLPGVILLANMVLEVACIHDELLNMDVPLPTFLPADVNITARRGDTARLTCIVQNLGTKEVNWRRIEEHGDRFLTIGKDRWAEETNIKVDVDWKAGNVTIWTLIVDNVQPRDAGIYECQVTSRAGLVRRLKLNVVGPTITKQVISITGKRYVDVGQPIVLMCNASGGTQVADEIDWFKGGDKIDSLKYRHVAVTKYQTLADRSFISTLSIDKSSETDTGNYICRSSRNDIADLSVTVLNANSDQTKRGVVKDPTPGASSRHGDDSAVFGSSATSPHTSSPSQSCLLLLVLLLVIRSWAFELYS